MIMRLDDPRLPANTPPLHYMCRSTLIPVDDWDWEDLTNGDERVLQRYFGYLKGPNAPRSLADALDGWKGAAPPLKGFGSFSPASADVEPALPNPKRPKSKATGTELRDWVENRKKVGLDDIDDLVDVGKYIHANIRSRISDLAPNLEKETRAARKVLATAQREVDIAAMTLKEANALKVDRKVSSAVVKAASKAMSDSRAAARRHKELFERLAVVRSEATSEVLAQVRPQGGLGQQWINGSLPATRQAVLRASVHYPTDWLEKSRKHGMLHGIELSRGEYRHSSESSIPSRLATRAGTSRARRYQTALHEMGHRMEKLIPELSRLAREYLEFRTAGEELEDLGELLEIRGMRGELTRKDKFSHAYFGKDYSDATEIISMGMEAVFLSAYNVWEEDTNLLDFMIGVLAAL